jgi:hypothetical protein
MAPTLSDELDKYASPRDVSSHPQRKGRRPRQEFIRGPLPVPWLAQAAALPGRALAVALAIWFRSGIEGSRTVTLFPSAIEKFKVNRFSAYRALAALEQAGLIAVTRQRGRSPSVTIIDLEPVREVPLSTDFTRG